MSTLASHPTPVTHRQTLADLLHRSACRTPHKLAVACGAQHYTYAEFDALCARVAAGLAQRGVAKGDARTGQLESGAHDPRHG